MSLAAVFTLVLGVTVSGSLTMSIASWFSSTFRKRSVLVTIPTRVLVPFFTIGSPLICFSAMSSKTSSLVPGTDTKTTSFCMQSATFIVGITPVQDIECR